MRPRLSLPRAPTTTECSQRPDAPSRTGASWRVARMLICLAVPAGCAPPAQEAAGAPGRLYALNALDGTLTPLDAERASPAGPPIPAGDAPAQAAPGPGGSLLIRSFSRTRPAALTHVARDRGALRARAVPMGAPLLEATLAADGQRYAAVAHHTPTLPTPEAGRPASPPADQAGRCRLTLLDLATGRARTHPACAPGELVAGLALGTAPEGPVAYLGVRDARGPQDAAEDTGPAPAAAAPGAAVPPRLRDRVVGVEARSGRVLTGRAPPRAAVVQPSARR